MFVVVCVCVVCVGGCTCLVQCTPDGYFQLQNPSVAFELKAQAELRRSTATNAMHEQPAV